MTRIVDPTSDEGLAWLDTDFSTWFAATTAVQATGRTRPTLTSEPSQLSDLRHSGAHWEFRALTSGDPSDPDAVALMMIPNSENLDRVWVEGGVHPDRRGRGLGSALLETVEALTRSLGRTRLTTHSAHDVGGPDQGGAFLHGHGFTVDLELIRRSWDLTATDFPALAHRFAPPPGYRILCWQGVTPDDRVDTMIELRTAMDADVPMGEGQDPIRWDGERIAYRDGRNRVRDFVAVTALALAPDGSPAGYTDLNHDPRQPTTIVQDDTLVTRAHRGQRLSAALKIAAARQLHELVPGTVWVDTWNAAVNAPMIAVNEAIGFRPSELLIEWGKKL